MKQFFFLILGLLLILPGCAIRQGDQTDDGITIVRQSEPASEPAEDIAAEDGPEAVHSVDTTGGEGDLLRRIQAARQEKQQALSAQSAVLSLRIAEENENGHITVQIVLQNPQMRPITSVRSFVAYDPDVLFGDVIRIPKESPFSIAAPGEQAFDPERGLAKIGLSIADQAGSSAEEIVIAEMLFIRKTAEFTTLDFFDFDGGDGHTVVLEKTGPDQYRNILQVPSVPTLLFLPQS